MNILLFGLAAVPMALIATRYMYIHWQRAMIAVLVLVVFEGALRKWVLPQASDYLYFLKDLMLIPVYLRMFGPGRSIGKHIPSAEGLGLLLAFNTLWCFIQVFNPRLGTPLVGLLGVRAYLYYIPLLWLIPLLFADQAALVRFLRGYLLLTIPLGILGIAQYFSPSSSLINVYVSGMEANASVGGNVRITSVFSYIAGYTTYLTVTFGVILPFLFTRQSGLWRWITLVELALIVANSLMTGSRGVILAQVLILLGYAIGFGSLRPSYFLSIALKLVIPGVIVAASLVYVFDTALNNFILRATSSDSVQARIVGSLREPANFVQYTGLSGYGIGATLPSGRALAQRLGQPARELIPVYYEPEPGRVMLELGPFGFVLWYGLRLYLLLLLWQTFRQLQTPLLRHLALAALLTTAVQITGQLVSNPTFIVYYWFLNSFIILLPRLERQVANQLEKWVHSRAVSHAPFIRPSYRQP